MYPAVLPRDVEKVLVPLPTNKVRTRCALVMQRCQAAWSDFFDAYSDAEELLHELVEPISAPPSLLETRRAEVDSQVIRRGDCFGDGSALRIDAEFFRHEFRVFARVALALGAEPLGKLCELAQGRVNAGSEQLPTFRQSSLTNFGINWAAVPLEPGSSQRGPFVERGDVLLATMAHEAHYLARNADSIGEMPDEIAAANQMTHHLTRIRLREDQRARVSPSYIAAFLRSETGRHQVQRCNRGVRGDHVRPDDLSTEVLVLIPSPDWLKRFDGKIAEAEQARRKASFEVSAGVDELEHWLDAFV